MRLLIALLLVASSFAANSAQRFSFAGLTWGDTIQAAGEKLRAAGYTALAPDSRWDIGSELDVHSQIFSGQVANHPFTAHATFAEEKLVKVSISWSLARPNQNAAEDIQQLLAIRYGKPSERGTPGHDYEKYWKGSSGDELTLSTSRGISWNSDSSLYATYWSPDALRRAAKGGVAAAAERRKELRAAEAASRARAAGL